LWNFFVNILDTIQIHYIVTSFRGKDKDSQIEVMLNNSVLYNGMIHSFTRMAIKGVIWYQGKLYRIGYYNDDEYF